MLTFIKLMLCVALVEIGVAVLRRLAAFVRPELPATPEPLRLTIRPSPAPPPVRRAPVLAPPEGVELAAVANHPEGARCRVCAHAIERGLLICSACEAPHHDDCWKYNGGCSTYGCRSGVARPAP